MIEIGSLDATVRADAADIIGRPVGSGSQLEAALAGRTKVPVERIAEYSSWPQERFRRELEEVNTILKRFAGAVAEAMEEPATAADFLAHLDLKLISQDHDWRAIFSTLMDQADISLDDKRVLLVRYLQYLGFRKRLVEFIFSRQGSLGETRVLNDVTTGLEETTLEGEPCLRLPLGEAVELRVPEAGGIELMLALHRFRLQADGHQATLVEDDGSRHVLRHGRNLVGRHPSADVVVDGRRRQISRAHLILEWHGKGRFTALDISTGGTFVPVASLWGKDRQLAGASSAGGRAFLTD